MNVKIFEFRNSFIVINQIVATTIQQRDDKDNPWKIEITMRENKVFSAYFESEDSARLKYGELMTAIRLCHENI
jgi:hypothetical protein